MHKNPLLESVINISHAGYLETKETRVQVHLPYANQKLVLLGTYLLSQNGHKGVTCVNHLRKKLVIGFSGGMDSYCAFIKAAQSSFWEEITLVFIRYGQPFYQYEENVVTKIRGALGGASNEFSSDMDRVKKLNGPKISFVTELADLVPRGQDISDFSNYIVPARNLVIAVTCAQYGNTVWIVANKRSDESVGTRDKTSKFYSLASSILTDYYGYQVTVESSAFSLSKIQMVENHLAEGWSKEALAATYSCYATPDYADALAPVHCGNCSACFKRYRILEAIGVERNFKMHPKDSPKWETFSQIETAKRG